MSLRKKIINNKPAYAKHRRVCSHPCGELDDEVGVVGLDLCLVCGLVADYRTAPVASVDDDISLFGIRLRPYRAQDSAAVVCSVTRIYIHVQGA